MAKKVKLTNKLMVIIVALLFIGMALAVAVSAAVS